MIEQERLEELLGGSMPESEAEQLLADNLDWLRIYLTHAIGEYPIEINLRRGLPKWNPSWLLSVE